MATLKDHQQAMVDLLASGSGIPASASRLAHAMHDVLKFMTTEQLVEHADWRCLDDATTPGLNDKALAGDLEACRPKATPAERRVKELENTVKQLRASNAELKGRLALVREQRDDELRRNMEHEQAGCRKDDAQVCAHNWRIVQYPFSNETYNKCDKCGAVEQ